MRSLGAKKFEDFLKDMGWNQEKAAHELDIVKSHVSMITSGKRRPSLDLAHKIAARTRRWSKGPIVEGAWAR